MRMTEAYRRNGLLLPRANRRFTDLQIVQADHSAGSAVLQTRDGLCRSFICPEPAADFRKFVGITLGRHPLAARTNYLRRLSRRPFSAVSGRDRACHNDGIDVWVRAAAKVLAFARLSETWTDVRRIRADPSLPAGGGCMVWKTNIRLARAKRRGT